MATWGVVPGLGFGKPEAPAEVHVWVVPPPACCGHCMQSPDGGLLVFPPCRGIRLPSHPL